jgi:uncharacterized repeat protein (TIGR02543 family)
MKKNIKYFYIILSFVFLSLTFISCDLGTEELVNTRVVKIYYYDNYSTSGNTPVDSSDYLVGQYITVKGNEGNLQRPGYQFQGWVTENYYSDNTISYIEGDQITADNNDIILYSKWSRNQFTVNFATNGGDTIPSITKYSNSYIRSFPEPTKEGSIFAGWYDNASLEGQNITSIYDINDNVILYAKWVEGSINPILKFSLKEDDTYEVYSSENHSVKKLIIPPYYHGKRVTSIKSHGFESSDFESITIPDTVEKIGIDAFNNNSYLTSLTLGSCLKTIETGAFKNTKISNLVIPNSVETIENYAFCNFNLNCLTNLTLGSGLKTIGDGAFEYSKITSLIIPNSVESIGDSAFRSNSYLKSITLGSRLKTIGSAAFMSDNLETLNIPNSVENIGSFAFSCNTSLINLTLGENIKEIGYSAFSNSNITSLVIPNNVQYIGDGAFDNNKSLTSLTLGTSLKQIGAEAFKNSAIETLVIPNSVEKIYAQAFYGIKSLKNLTLGSSLNYIGTEAFYNLGDSEFSIPNSVETIDSKAFFSTIQKTINCQTNSKPSGWIDDWYGKTNATIIWATK